MPAGARAFYPPLNPLQLPARMISVAGSEQKYPVYARSFEDFMEVIEELADGKPILHLTPILEGARGVAEDDMAKLYYDLPRTTEFLLTVAEGSQAAGTARPQCAACLVLAAVLGGWLDCWVEFVQWTGLPPPLFAKTTPFSKRQFCLVSTTFGAMEFCGCPFRPRDFCDLALGKMFLGCRLWSCHPLSPLLVLCRWRGWQLTTGTFATQRSPRVFLQHARATPFSEQQSSCFRQMQCFYRCSRNGGGVLGATG